MFLLQLVKEIRVFFTSKGNLLFMLLMPILLISLFGYALKDYVKGDYQTFEGGKVFYLADHAEKQKVNEFTGISERITMALGVKFEEVSDYEDAVKRVEGSEAYGIVTIKNSGYEYFRSTFNEPEGGKIVRTLFCELAENNVADGSSDGGTYVEKIRININKTDSKQYYTFAGLAFSILFLGLLVAFSVYDEKEYGTIERIKLSNAGIGAMITSKVLTGVMCGCVMIGVSYLFSHQVLKVEWGDKKAYIMLILLCLVLLSSMFGCVVGITGKNKTICQSSVLMCSMLCGYLGGSITPLYLLENVPVLNWLVKISPLYWTNRAIASLQNGIVDEKMTYSITVLMSLTILLMIVCLRTGRKAVNRA